MVAFDTYFALGQSWAASAEPDEIDRVQSFQLLLDNDEVDTDWEPPEVFYTAVADLPPADQGNALLGFVAGAAGVWTFKLSSPAGWLQSQTEL